MAPTSTQKDTSSHSGRTIKIPKPQPGGEAIFTSCPSGELLLDFDPSGTAALREGNSLIFTLNDGGKVIIEDFFAVGNSLLPTFILPDGTRAEGANYLKAQYPTLDLTTAVGTPSLEASSGGEGEYTDASGELLHGVDKLHDLGATYWNGRETSLPSAFSPATRDAFDSGSAGTAGTSPSGPATPSTTPLYNARAVLYTQNTASLDPADYTVSLKGLSVSDPADCCWNDPTADYAGYLTLSVDGSGAPVLTLTQVGLDALSNNGPNIYGYLNVTSGGTDYTVQVVVNQTNDHDSPTEDATCLADCGALPAGLVHGEWHEGVDYHTGVNRIDSSGLGDRIFFSSGLSANGSGTGNDIHTHTQTGKVATVDAGTAASSCAMSATNGGSNTIDGGTAGGGTNVALTAALGSGTGMYAGQDAENHIVRAATTTVTAKNGLIAENDGLNELDVSGAVRLAVVTAGLDALNARNEISAGGDMTVTAVNTTAAETSYGMRAQATSGTARNTVVLQNDKTLALSVDSTVGAAVGIETRADATLGTASAVTGISGADDLSVSVAGTGNNIGIHTEAGAVNSSASDALSAGGSLTIAVQAKNAVNTVAGVVTESLGNAAPAQTNLQAEDISITVAGNVFSDDAKGLHTEGTGARAALSADTAAVDVTNLKSNAVALSTAVNGVSTITAADMTPLSATAKLDAYGMRANAGGLNDIDTGEAALTVRGDGRAKGMWAGAGGTNTIDAVTGIELDVKAVALIANGMDVDGDTSENALTAGGDIAVSVEAGGTAIGMRASDKGLNTVDAGGDVALGAHSTGSAAFGMFAETKAKNTIESEGTVAITVTNNDLTARAAGIYAFEGKNEIIAAGDVRIIVGDAAENLGVGAGSIGIYTKAQAAGSDALNQVASGGKLTVAVEADDDAQKWIYGVRTYNGIEGTPPTSYPDYNRRAETELKADEMEIIVKGGASTELAVGVASSGEIDPLTGDVPSHVYTRAHTALEADSVTVAAEAMNAAGKAHGLEIFEFGGIDIAAHELSVSAKAGKDAAGIYTFAGGSKPDSANGADTMLPEAQRGYAFGAHIAGTDSGDVFALKAEADFGTATGIHVVEVGRVTIDGGVGNDALAITAESRDAFACGIHAGLASPRDLAKAGGTSQFGQSGTVLIDNVEHVVVTAESKFAGACGIQAASRDGGNTIRVSGSDALTAEITAIAKSTADCAVGVEAHVGKNKILGAAGDDSISIAAVNTLGYAYGLSAHTLGTNLIDTGAGHDAVVITAKGGGNSSYSIAAGMSVRYAGTNTVTTGEGTVTVSAEGSRYNHAMKVIGTIAGPGANRIHNVQNGDDIAVTLKADKGVYNSVMDAGYGTNTVEDISGKVSIQALNGSSSSAGVSAATRGENILRNISAQAAASDDAVVRIEARSSATGDASGIEAAYTYSKNTLSDIINTGPDGCALKVTASAGDAAALYAAHGENSLRRISGTVQLTAEGGDTAGRALLALDGGLNRISDVEAVRINASALAAGTAAAMFAGQGVAIAGNIIEDTVGGISTDSVTLTATTGNFVYGMYADRGENTISTPDADVSVTASGGVTNTYGVFASGGGKNSLLARNVSVTATGEIALKALAAGSNQIATSDADARVILTGDVVSSSEGTVAAGQNSIAAGTGDDFVKIAGAFRGDRTGSGWGTYAYSNELTTGTGNDTVAVTGGASGIIGSLVDLGTSDNLLVAGSAASGLSAGDTLSVNPASWGTPGMHAQNSAFLSGAGNDTLLVHGSLSSTLVSSGAGDDIIAVARNIDTRSLIDAGSGNNAITLNGAAIHSTIRAGSGNDTLTIAPVSGSNSSAAIFSLIDLGDGKNVVSIASGDSGMALSGGSHLYTGTGDDAITLSGNVGGTGFLPETLGTTTTIRTGSGSDTVTINGNTNHAIIALGTVVTGADTTGSGDYNHLNIYGNVGDTKIYGAAGRDDVILDAGSGNTATAVTSVTINTGDGRDRVYVNGTIETSNLNGGTGHDTFAFTDNTTVDAASTITNFEALHFVHLGDSPTAGTLFQWETDGRFAPFEAKIGAGVKELGYEILGGDLGTSGASVTVYGNASASYARFLHVQGSAWADIEMSNRNDTVAIDHTFNGSIDAGAGDDYVGVGVFGASVGMEGGTGMDTLALCRFGVSEGFNYGMDELLHSVSISGFEVLDITYSGHAPRAITFDAKVSDFSPDAHLDAGLFANDGDNTLETLLTNASAVLRLVGDADDTVNLVGYTAYSGPDSPSVTYQGVAYNVYEDIEHNYLLISKNILDITGG